MKWTNAFPALTLCIVACSEYSYNPEEIDEVVVFGCLVADSRVENIRLTMLAPYGGDTQASDPVSDAAISIDDGTSRWELISSDDSGHYHCPDTTLATQAGKTYTITIEHSNKNITASTVVPERPTGLSLSESVLYIDTALTMQERMEQMREGEDASGITLSFANPLSLLHYVTIENVDPAPVDIPMDSLPGGMFRGARFLSAPFSADTYVITYMNLTQFGKHKIVLYRVNQEYADLYDFREQDSRSLNEPKTNVTNGLGIFTAVNCDSIFFEAKAAQ